MTRQHFKLIAEALYLHNIQRNPDMRGAVRLATASVAEELYLNNPNFNRAKFLDAAGATEVIGNE